MSNCLGYHTCEDCGRRSPVDLDTKHEYITCDRCINSYQKLNRFQIPLVLDLITNVKTIMNIGNQHISRETISEIVNEYSDLYDKLGLPKGDING